MMISRLILSLREVTDLTEVSTSGQAAGTLVFGRNPGLSSTGTSALSDALWVKS